MKRMFVIMSMCLLALGLSFAGGCSQGASDALTEDDSDTAVVLQAGDQLTVRLISNASTGYQWVVVDEGPLVQAGDPVYEQPEADNAVGAAGTQLFTFDAPEAGAGTLTLEYRRSWETTAPAEDTWTVDVTVE